MKNLFSVLITLVLLVYGLNNFIYADEANLDEIVGEDEIISEADKAKIDDLPTEKVQKKPRPAPKISPYEMIYRLSLLCAPLSSGHLNGLYSLVGYSRMEQTSTVIAGSFYSAMTMNLSSYSSYNDDPNFDAILMKLTLECRYGIIENLEAGLRLGFAGWDGSIIVPGLEPNSEAGTNLSDIFLDVKYNFFSETRQDPYALSGLISVKFPTGSQDDVLSTGAIDFSIAALASYYMLNHELGFHALLGLTFAGDSDKIEAESLTLGALLNCALGATYVLTRSRSFSTNLIWQLEFYDPNLDTTLGFRGFITTDTLIIVPELAMTLGLHKLSSDMTLHFSVKIIF